MSAEDLSKLNLVELYDLLQAPDAPEAISMWPQTSGWLWLAATVLILIALLILLWKRWRDRNAYRRAGLAALKAAGDDPAMISDVLRRTALVAFPRDSVAQTYGAGWLALLDGSAQHLNFSGSEAGRILAAAPYQPQAPHKDLSGMAEKWIRTHHRAKQG